ncbi:hypothetical protein DCAR_0207071 [Daucus carota subsp. sativus]|uniref:Mechanosensitive ion channel protein n=1 Tax=Daucus carota subsp. sativus TaxID=79200 RepID=A0A166DMK0_DAUCS|nr:PREDICTED: mechanosensitive ion channel protein 8-like [Daucus carota subsp. sativus]WOG87839.1 hypothetical protein DCAR_0207071 [Daucus carota subsp. sativus]
MAAKQAEVVVKISGQSSPEADQTAKLSGQSPANTTGEDGSCEITNDTDFEIHTESPTSQPSPLSRIVESPTSENLRRRSGRAGGNGNGSGTSSDEVVTCNSNSSFRRKSSLLRMKAKSRLMDPPGMDERSVKSDELDEDDPFPEYDIPEKYKTMKLGKWTVLQCFILILIVAALVFSLFKKWRLFGLQLWKWYVVVVLICGRLVSGWGIRVVMFLVEKNFMLRKRVLYFVYGLRKGVQNCIWLALILIALQLIFDKTVERVTNWKILPHVTRIWVCLLVGILVWLVKTFLVKVFASAFHVSTYFDRIQESLFD